MANTMNSRDFRYFKLLSRDCHVLQDLAEKSLKEPYFPSILGKTVVENKDLANAYATNKELYPHAFIIIDKNGPKTPIGFLLTQSSKKGNSLDLEIAMTGEKADYHTLLVLKDFMNFIGSDYHIIWHCNNKRILEIADALLTGSIEE